MKRIERREFVAIAAGAVIGGAASPQTASADSPTSASSEERSAMDIQRIGITTPNGGIPGIGISEPSGGLPVISLASVHAGLVCICGVTADPNKLGDVKDQTRQVLELIDRLLARAGTTKSKLLSAQVWLTDMSLFADHNEAWNAWVDAKNPPVRACLHSPSLWRPGMLVEIMATAAL
jgi:enamine deaminase RidA (YjgF/YER057c/UK114 family)